MVRSATSTALRVAFRELELYDTGDVAGADEVFAPDLIDHTPVAGAASAIDGMRALIAAVRGGFTDTQHRIVFHRELSDGWVVVHWQMTGTHRRRLRVPRERQPGRYQRQRHHARRRRQDQRDLPRRRTAQINPTDQRRRAARWCALAGRGIRLVWAWGYSLPVLRSALPFRTADSRLQFSGWTLSHRLPLPRSIPSLSSRLNHSSAVLILLG
jgi:SnoaL-like polyketide cyclase